MYGLGARLKEMRKMINLSQSQVARRLNLSPGTISGYELDTKTPSLEVLSDLAILYNCSADYLLGHDKKEAISIEGLNSRQKEILNTLLLEFKSTQK